jgi:ABC-2 type transport system permease protein
MNKYSQLQATLAVAKASIKALFRSPSSLVFSIVFPLLFILLFGFLGGSGIKATVVLTPNSDTTNSFYIGLKKTPTIVISKVSVEEAEKLLSKGRITAILHVERDGPVERDRVKVNIKSSQAAADRFGILKSSIDAAIYNTNQFVHKQAETVAVTEVTITEGKKFKEIDFVLPGQLGFSLLSTGLFGVAFLLFNLKESLVLKRYFATPVSKLSLLVGEGLARVVFQLVVSAVILLLGKYAFGFTLSNGWLTFVELLIMSAIGVFVFMGFGFLISALAKQLSTIPALTNLFGFPQFLLSGTFFSINAFPVWLKPIAMVLPLTHLNNAMRKISFEGYHITDCGYELMILAIWSIVLFIAASKLFKWE